jgi:pimeloyl-ACP methyl ester carboxylesterase
MLHAGVADRRMWRETLPYLGGTHLAIAYDRRGFGETRSSNEPFLHVDDLDRVVDHFGSREAILIGCSQGGRVAIDYALAYPEKVTALVLVAAAITGAPAPDEFPPDIARRMADLDEAEERGDIGRVNAIETHLWLDGPLSVEGRVAGAARRLFLDMNRIALQHVPLTLEQSCPSAFDRMGNIAAPAFVVWGNRDFPHIQERSQWLANTIPSAQSLVMEGCAHLPNLEQPERFNAALGSFLAEVGRRPRLGD